jgi:hypothetical protein
MLNWALRYSSAVEVLDALGPASVLDVGSGDHGLNRFRQYELVVRTDIQVPERLVHPGPFIVADALRLPVRTASVDAALSIDMIEHLRPAERPVAVAELCRVARSYVVVAFPVGAAARRTDAVYAGLLRVAHKPAPGWLLEHGAVDYPRRAAFLDAVPTGWRVTRTLRNGNAMVQTISVLADSSRHTAAAAERVAQRGVRRGFPRLLHAWPAYRAIFVLERVSA